MKNPIDVKVTKEGLENLKLEEKNLIAKRPGVLTRMVAAREQGDLSENAGFHAAKEELRWIDRRLRELKLFIRFAVLIEDKGGNTISQGSTVVVDNGNGPMELMIVGKMEADPSKGKMSDESPIGNALLGKMVGDNVVVQIPDGKVTYRVMEIKSRT